ncbi:MAG TPA: sugar MFS transporter [Sphingobacterium sp.]|nr:sugar MFS transporter [Sphingobacterium sp.]
MMNNRTALIYPLFIIGILFFVFGFITWANGVLIPYFRVGLELTNFQSTLVAFSAYLAYFFMAIPSAWILKRTGYKKGMFVGLLVMALGTLLFVPAAYSRAYWLFLTGLFVTGTGLALLQTAANPYVAVIGPIESTARRIGFMGLANKIAGFISLAALGSLFLADADTIIEQIAAASAVQKEAILRTYILGVVNPYLVITILLVALAIMIYFSKLPEVNESAETPDVAERVSSKKSVFQYPQLFFGIVALFFSSACEVIPIDGIILYSSALGLPIAESRYFAQYTLVAMTMGYVASIFLIPKYLSQQGALLMCTLWGIVMTIGAYFTSGVLSVVFVIAMGFSSAMLWGTIWGLALQGLGRFTKMGSALLLMSVVGGGIFPVIFGRLMDVNVSLPQNALLLLIPCNLVMFVYAVWAYRLNRN